MSILIVRPDHLGDLLFTTPALSLLRRSLPDARLVALVGPWGVGVLRGNPNLDDIITCDFPWFNRRPKRTAVEPYSELWREAKSLARYRFSMAISLRFDFWWGAAMCSAAGIPRVLGYDIPSCLPFLTDTVPYTSGVHEVRQNLRLVDATCAALNVGVAVGGGEALEFYESPSDTSSAVTMLSELELGESSRLVVLHPGSGASNKLWTLTGYVEVARRILEQRNDVKLAVTGGPGERDLTRAVCAELPGERCIDLGGKTDLGQLAAIFRRCALAIGVDSGPMHLAVACGAPTVHLFGPSNATLFGPYGAGERHVVVTSGLPCIPCGRLASSASAMRAEVRLPPCMARLDVAEVARVCLELLDRSA